MHLLERLNCLLVYFKSETNKNNNKKLFGEVAYDDKIKETIQNTCNLIVYAKQCT